ncbi:DUF2489 domain-containing protein [Umboniibacter marinipuniceus]|uniref:Uncharacterized protein DUF2489 n=1 Tax=Umboniibacter marinipuniceus TaxID=569599 RepID=A0A3M0A8B9_9GAMM|nr:DUF2489 domain-containing protein [Umboniibacter marinipuniceus]RMA81070.1 uncharacterized protein DUF2489 [Umboniibacter marinipuniceus]
MLTATILIGFILAISIIVVLAIYALKLTKQVKQVQADQALKLKDIEVRAEAAMDEVALGITVLARAHLQGELSSTEACLRICHSMDQLQLSSLYRGIYPAIFEVSDRAQDFPIMAAYKALSPKEQFKLDRQRDELEQEFEESVKRSMTGLSTFERPKFDDAAA